MATELEEKLEEQATEEQSYEDAFDEFVSGKEPEAAKEPEGKASTPEEDEAPSTKDSEDDGEPSSQSKSSDSKEEDWIAKLPEEFREQAQALRKDYEKRDNEYRAQVGRVRSLQERLDEERARRAAAAQASQPTQQSTKTPDGEEKEELPEELAKLQKEYPDLYKVVKTMSSHEISRVMPKIEEQIKPLNQREQQRAYQENLKRFEEMADGILNTKETGVTYRDVFGSEEYAEFLDEQPEYVQRMARTSTDPKEAAWILEQYVKQERIKYLESEGSSQERKDPVKERRKQLEKNVSPRSKSPATNAGDGMDSYEDYFNYFASKN